MSQLVFLHGPGAGACSDAFYYQLKHFPGSVAPTLPGHLSGMPCTTVDRYTEWVRGWLWAQGHTSDLVLVGYTLGACIALQYGLDYPDEVKGLLLMSVAMRSKERSQEVLNMRLRAAENPTSYQEWWAFQQRAMSFVDAELKARLMERHRQVGPISQYHDLVTIDSFDVRDRMHTLKPKLVLVRGLDDPGHPPEYELEIHKAVPGSRYITLQGAGHFPMAERPNEVNRAIQELLVSAT